MYFYSYKRKNNNVLYIMQRIYTIQYCMYLKCGVLRMKCSDTKSKYNKVGEISRYTCTVDSDRIKSNVWNIGHSSWRNMMIHEACFS